MVGSEDPARIADPSLDLELTAALEPTDQDPIHPRRAPETPRETNAVPLDQKQHGQYS